jgi:hypothetical protein
MASAARLRTALIDTSLAVGLLVSLGVVYKVETRVTRPPAGKQWTKRETILGSVYELRTAPRKEALILELGGTPETEAAVQAGLDWLVRHQAADGSWSSACLGPKRDQPLSRCAEPGPPCSDPGSDYSMAQTGLALLALQAPGHYDFNERPYSPQVRRGLEWMAARQDPAGALVGPNSGTAPSYRTYFMYEHAIASFALAEACAVRKALGEGPDPQLDRAARKAIGFIVAQQHDDGGWRYKTDKKEQSDTSVSGWAMLALKSALEAGLPVSPKTVARTRDFFRKCETEDGKTGYKDPSSTRSDALTAVGVLVHLLLLKEHDSPLVRKAVPYLDSRAETHARMIHAGQAEFYTLYNVTLALYQAGGDHWEHWNHEIRDAVVENQIAVPGCLRGSWSPQSTNGASVGGRIYSTALGTLILEVYYRYARKPGQGPDATSAAEGGDDASRSEERNPP